MCYHRSCIVTKDEKILFHPQSDHHTQIRKAFGIRELRLNEERNDHVALECVPVHSLFDLNGWRVKLDQNYKPDWYDKTIEKAVMEKMVSEFKRRAVPEAKVYRAESDLAFGYLECFDDESVLISGGQIVLSGFKKPLRGLVIKAPVVIIPRIEYRFYTPPLEGCVISCDALRCEDEELKHYLVDSGQVVFPKHDIRKIGSFYDDVCATAPLYNYSASRFKIKSTPHI